MPNSNIFLGVPRIAVFATPISDWDPTQLPPDAVEWFLPSGADVSLEWDSEGKLHTSSLNGLKQAGLYRNRPTLLMKWPIYDPSETSSESKGIGTGHMMTPELDDLLAVLERGAAVLMASPGENAPWIRCNDVTKKFTYQQVFDLNRSVTLEFESPDLYAKRDLGTRAITSNIPLKPLIGIAGKDGKDGINGKDGKDGKEGPASTVPGPANVISIGTVVQGTAGATITGTTPAQVLNLQLPKGDTGAPNVLKIGTVAQGSAAATITGTTPSQTLNLTIPAGPANTLTIGTVAQGPAAATITGTSPSQTLNLVIPKGDTGAPSTVPGPANVLNIGTVAVGTAAASITGTTPSQTLNLTLPPGPANTLAIGTVVSGPTPSVTVTGTAPTQTLNFVLQKGDTGATGSLGLLKATAPIYWDAGTSTMSMSLATATVNGYLSFTDWKTFNAKWTPGTALSATTGTFSGVVVAGAGKGFQSVSYIPGENPIWGFGSFPEYGITYYEKTGTTPTTGKSSFGFHFGDSAKPKFWVNDDGGVMGFTAEFSGPITQNGNSVIIDDDERLTNPRPASDVQAWAKGLTKPTYTALEVGGVNKSGDSGIGNLSMSLMTTEGGIVNHATYPNLGFKVVDITRNNIAVLSGNFIINSRDTTGATIDNPLTIVNATNGAITFSASRMVNMGALTTGAGTFTGNTSVGGYLSIGGAVLENKKVMGAETAISPLVANFFEKTITGPTTFTITGLASTRVNTFILDITNGGTGIVTWWAGIRWAGGTPPTLTITGRDVLGFFSHDAGATWTGLVMAKDVK